MDSLFKKLEKTDPTLLFGLITAGGLLIFILGLLFLVFSRRIVKLLYYFSAAKLFFLLTIVIGSLIVVSKEEVEVKESTIWIILGTAIGFSQLGGFLAACFGKLGIVFLGLSGGYDLWQIFAGFVPSDLANLILSICFAIAGACVCVAFKRPMEILIAAFCGATYFSFGLLFTIMGIMGLTSSSPEIFSGSVPLYGSIASLCTSVLLFIVSLWYHFSSFVDAKNEESRPFMRDV